MSKFIEKRIALNRAIILAKHKRGREKKLSNYTEDDLNSFKGILDSVRSNPGYNVRIEEEKRYNIFISYEKISWNTIHI